MEKKITVFTPTFNRGYCLPKLYSSLLRQTCKEFIWLIVDDGSNDDTQKIVNKWKIEDIIEIHYVYQNNGGMLAAHNTAYDNIETELNLCIDSDDYMTDDAIEIILDRWIKFRKPNHAGILGLDIDKFGKVLGVEFPSDNMDVKFTSLKKRFKNLGDKKFVYRTDVINRYPRFPIIANEKFPAAGLLYRLIDKEYDLLAINEPLCVVEYMADGNSKNKITQYKRNPNAFALYRIERIKLATDFKDKFINNIHYVSSCIIGKRFDILRRSPTKLLTLFALPFGFFLYLYIVKTKRKGIIK